MGDPAGRQRRLRSQHGGCAGSLSKAAQPNPPRGLPGRDRKAVDFRNACVDRGEARQVARYDYEYERNGTANLFMMFAPLEGWRHVKVTDRHAAVDYAQVLKELSDTHFPHAEKIVLVQDNLNTHKAASLYEAFRPPTQAILPLRGKILNVASATRDKLAQNQQLSDLVQALGAGTGSHYRSQDLRYDKIIIMTDADVDGAHIASLLITFFYRQTPKLIEEGHLYIAVPPLYRLTQGAKSIYARDDADKERLMKAGFSGRGAIEVSRFKGLGEMPMRDLRDTTMDPARRVLLRVAIADDDGPRTADTVERLMGAKPEARFALIQERAPQARELVDI